MIPNQHHKIQFESYGAAAVLKMTEAKLPVPNEHEVLVEVAATGVNYIETYQRSGSYRVPLPYTPGTEFAGTVVKVGDRVSRLKIGDRVSTANGLAGYAQYAVVAEDKAVKIPEDLDFQTAAAITLQGLTAHYLATSSYAVKAGDTALVHAGAGGVGLILTQLLKSKSVRVITTASTDQKRELSKANGADHSIEYNGFAAQLRKITEGKGADVVYDGVGKDTFFDSLKAIKLRGSVVVFGAASGAVPEFDLQLLNQHGSIFLSRPSLPHFVADWEELNWRSQEIFELVLAGKIKVTVGAKFELSEASAAHQLLESRKSTAKLLLIP